MRDPFVQRHAAAQAKENYGDDKAPEVKFLAVAKGMGRIWFLITAVDAQQQQSLVACVCQRVDSSDSIDELPVKKAAANLVIAIRRFAAIAP